jgi:hypothetical protein
MSREERRQYERMMRNMERGQNLPPAARARAERNAARRAARAAARPQTHGFTARFLVVSLLISAAVGYIVFSLQWPQPQAPVLGIAAGAIALAAQVGIRLLQRRASRRA